MSYQDSEFPKPQRFRKLMKSAVLRNNSAVVTNENRGLDILTNIPTFVVVKK